MVVGSGESKYRILIKMQTSNLPSSVLILSFLQGRSRWLVRCKRLQSGLCVTLPGVVLRKLERPTCPPAKSRPICQLNKNWAFAFSRALNHVSGSKNRAD